jgi:hypothetical protein
LIDLRSPPPRSRRPDFALGARRRLGHDRIGKLIGGNHAVLAMVEIAADAR